MTVIWAKGPDESVEAGEGAHAAVAAVPLDIQIDDVAFVGVPYRLWSSIRDLYRDTG